MPKSRMLNSQSKKYVAVGIFNTLMGYLIGVGGYEVLIDKMGIVWIGFITNIVSISVSFITYKTLVFKTRGKWLTEYIKAYMVYGGIALIGIFLLWLFVDIMRISIWQAQAIVMACGFIFSYLGHSRFTFTRKKSSNDE